MIKAIAGTVLNVSTGGLWGAAKWIGRRFKGGEGRQSFTGKVAALVMSHAIFSVLIGTVSIWGLFKGVGYLMAIILWLCFGYKVEPPANEREQGRNFLARAEDAAEAKFDKLKEQLDAQRRRMEDDFARRRKELDEHDLAERATRVKRDAEEQVVRAKAEAAELAAKTRREAEEDVARARAKAEEKERELANRISPGAAFVNGIASLFEDDRIELDCPVCLKTLKFNKEDAEKQALCRKCNITFALQGIQKTASASPVPVGVSPWVECLWCGLSGQVPGDGKSKMFGCPTCNKHSYFMDGTLRYVERHPEPTYMRYLPPAPSPSGPSPIARPDYLPK